MTEEVIYSGLFSGLAPKDKSNRLLDELYGDSFEQLAARDAVGQRTSTVLSEQSVAPIWPKRTIEKRDTRRSK